MTTRERILTLANGGHESHLIAAILGIEVAAVAEVLADPERAIGPTSTVDIGPVSIPHPKEGEEGEYLLGNDEWHPSVSDSTVELRTYMSIQLPRAESNLVRVSLQARPPGEGEGAEMDRFQVGLPALTAVSDSFIGFSLKGLLPAGWEWRVEVDKFEGGGTVAIEEAFYQEIT